MLNKVKMIAVFLGLGVFAFAGDNPLFKVFDLPEEERSAVVDYCEPTEFQESILNNGMLQRKYLHPSESLGMEKDEEPPYDYIEHGAPNEDKLASQKRRLFFAIITDGNSKQFGCDRATVLYIAKFIKRYWPGSPLCLKYPKSARIVDDMVKRWRSVPLMKHAAIEARAMLAADGL